MHCLCIYTTIVALVATTTVVHAVCINNTNYTGIEHSLVSNNENLVNLSQAFFPTNRQPSISVQVTYQFKNGSDHVWYRWVDSPIILFIHSDLLFYLSLSIYKVDVRNVMVTLDPIKNFAEEKINGTDSSNVCVPNHLPGHHLLNNLTANLLSYAAHRGDETKIDPRIESGYSVFVYDFGPTDFCIFDEVGSFLQMRMFLLVSVSILEIAIGFASPLLLIGVDDSFQKKMQENSKVKYFVWSLITVVILLAGFMSGFNGRALAMYSISGSPDSFTFFPHEVNLFLFCFFVFVFISDGILISFALCCRGYMHRATYEYHENNWCLNCYHVNCFKYSPYMNGSDDENAPLIPSGEDSHRDSNQNQLEAKSQWSIKCCIWSKNAFFFFAMFCVTLFIQLVLFNSIFISLAVVAAPIEAGSLIILYLANIFTFVSFLALILKLANNNVRAQNSKILFFLSGIGVFLLFLIGSGLLVTFMYVYTILIQEYRNSRGVIAFIGPILPSLLASAVGGILVKIFPKESDSRGTVNT